MTDPGRLAQALVAELAFTGSDELLERVAAVAEPRTAQVERRMRASRASFEASLSPHEDPVFVLGRDEEWRHLVARALEVADG